MHNTLLLVGFACALRESTTFFAIHFPSTVAHATNVRVLLWAVRATEHLALALRAHPGATLASVVGPVDAVAAAAFSLMLSLVPENVVDAF